MLRLGLPQQSPEVTSLLNRRIRGHFRCRHRWRTRSIEWRWASRAKRRWPCSADRWRPGRAIRIAGSIRWLTRSSDRRWARGAILHLRTKLLSRGSQRRRPGARCQRSCERSRGQADGTHNREHRHQPRDKTQSDGHDAPLSINSRLFLIIVRREPRRQLPHGTGSNCRVLMQIKFSLGTGDSTRQECISRLTDAKRAPGVQRWLPGAGPIRRRAAKPSARGEKCRFRPEGVLRDCWLSSANFKTHSSW
jgi:hypothetical protein